MVARTLLLAFLFLSIGGFAQERHNCRSHKRPAPTEARVVTGGIPGEYGDINGPVIVTTQGTAPDLAQPSQQSAPLVNARGEAILPVRRVLDLSALTGVVTAIPDSDLTIRGTCGNRVSDYYYIDGVKVRKR